METSPDGRDKLSEAKKKRKPRKGRQRMRKREERINNEGGEWVVKQEGRPKGSFLSQGGGRGSGSVAAENSERGKGEPGTEECKWPRRARYAKEEIFAPRAYRGVLRESRGRTTPQEKPGEWLRE